VNGSFIATPMILIRSFPRPKFYGAIHMRYTKLENFYRYALVFSTVGVAALATAVLHPATGEEALFFFAAVTISTLYGGLVPGLVSIALSVLSIDYFFARTISGFTLVLYNVPLLAIFVSLTLLISCLVEFRRRAKEQLRRANADLEQQVKDRTSELTRANRIKDEFLAIVSHDLRQPLNSILGWLKIIDSHPNDHQLSARALAVIGNSAREQVRLVTQLLDISRIGRGDFSLECRPVEFASIVEVVAEQLTPNATAKNIDIKLLLDQNVGEVSGDRDRLLQVVSNLLGNAMKFTPEGGRVVVRLSRVDSQAELSVVDDGAGISADFIPHIFEPFRAGANGRISGGLGLGLAIVKAIVETHGGRVIAQSEGEGKGSKFVVTLPLSSPVGV
jgi:signal transduction histidine kinase